MNGQIVQKIASTAQKEELFCAEMLETTVFPVPALTLNREQGHIFLDVDSIVYTCVLMILNVY